MCKPGFSIIKVIYVFFATLPSTTFSLMYLCKVSRLRRPCGRKTKNVSLVSRLTPPRIEMQTYVFLRFKFAKVMSSCFEFFGMRRLTNFHPKLQVKMKFLSPKGASSYWIESHCSYLCL